MSTNQAELLRKALHNVVSQRTVVDEDMAIQETMLIRNGAYCGRRFTLKGFSLVWFQEEGQVKLFSSIGTLEQSCSVAQFCESSHQQQSYPIRRAA